MESDFQTEVERKEETMEQENNIKQVDKTNNLSNIKKAVEILENNTEEMTLKEALTTFSGLPVLPATSPKNIENFIAELEEINSKEKTLVVEDKNIAGVIKLNANSFSQVAFPDNNFQDLINNNISNWSSKIPYGDKEISLKRRVPKSNKKGVLDKNTALALFNDKLGFGAIAQIPLIHSGFWVELKKISNSDLYNLDTKLAQLEVSLAKSTGGLIYSNYKLAIIRVLLEFIISKISTCSLKVKDYSHIKKYLLIQDIYPLMLLILAAQHPKGFPITRICQNSTIINEEKTGMKCGFIGKTIVNPFNLLWMNDSILKESEIKHMLKMSPGSMEESDVIEYQRTLDCIKDKTIYLHTEEGESVKIILSTPNASKYIVHGERWVKNIENDVLKLFTTDMSVEYKNAMLLTRSALSILNTYSHFIGRMYLPDDDESYVEDIDAIEAMLDNLLQNEKLHKTLLDEIKTYIDETTIAVVGLPDYICPKCKKQQLTRENRNIANDEIIPIDSLELVLHQSTQKLNHMIETE